MGIARKDPNDANYFCTVNFFTDSFNDITVSMPFSFNEHPLWIKPVI